MSQQVHASGASWEPQTRLEIRGDQFAINGRITCAGSAAEGLLMNVRLVNGCFEDLAADTPAAKAGFDPQRNTDEFIASLPARHAHGIRAVTICLQGGFCGYEGAINSAFEPDGSLRPGYMSRVERIVRACDRLGLIVILGCFYQRQSRVLRDAEAVRAALRNVARWLKEKGFTNVLLEVANEFWHAGFAHEIIRSAAGQVELIRLARVEHPRLLVGTSGCGDLTMPASVAEASDVILVHGNTTAIDDYPQRLEALKSYGKPVVVNEDEKIGAAGCEAAEVCVGLGVSWGYMNVERNQHWPFEWQIQPGDDQRVYEKIRDLTRAG